MNLRLVLAALAATVLPAGAGAGAPGAPLGDGSDAAVVEPSQDPRNFGTSDTSILALSAYDFQLVSGGGIEGDGNLQLGARECGSVAGCYFAAGVHLPTGTIVTGLEAELCDSSNSTSVVFSFYRHPSPFGNGGPVGPLGTTGLTEVPGCGAYSVALDHTIDNLTGKYMVLLGLGTGTEVAFLGARVRYRYQVAPPPASASFGDVPVDHPQFQFIEALFASGITAGCGGGNYCPGSSLTRGQMAVFLAKALGLHFPN